MPIEIYIEGGLTNYVVANRDGLGVVFARGWLILAGLSSLVGGCLPRRISSALAVGGFGLGVVAGGPLLLLILGVCPILAVLVVLVGSLCSLCSILTCL